MMKIALPKIDAISPNQKRLALGAVLATVVGVGTFVGVRLSNANATPPPEAADATAPPAANTTSALSGAPAAPPAPMPTTVQIAFSTYPAVYATVTWGKALLGRITPHEPLVVTRPRDSGPLDVIVRAPAYLPVHTRAHTFADAKLNIKLTRYDQKNTLFGYRAPIDAGTPLDVAPGATPATGTGPGEVQQPPP